MLERDPGESSGLAVNRQRGGSQGDHDGGYAEMAMFLCAGFSQIPEDISRLSEDEAAKAIPRRFCDRGMREEVDHLWTGGGAGGGFTLFGGEECDESCRRDTGKGGWEEEETEEEQESGERGWVRASL